MLHGVIGELRQNGYSKHQKMRIVNYEAENQAVSIIYSNDRHCYLMGLPEKNWCNRNAIAIRENRFLGDTGFRNRHCGSSSKI
jgi:hypothetical protein